MSGLTNLLRNQSPSWRANEVERCLRHRPTLASRVQDPYIESYLKVAKELVGGRDVTIKLINLAKDPALVPYCEVHQLVSNPYGQQRFGNNTQTAFQRSVLDALAICNVDYKEISDLTGTSVEAVKIYEALYLDIRQRPQLWIVSMILQPLFNSFSTSNFDSLLKFAAFALGRSGVDQILMTNQLTDEDLIKLRNKAMGWRNIKAAASSVMIPVDKYDHIEFERQITDEHIQEKKLTIQAKEVDLVGNNAEVLGAPKTFIDGLLSAHQFTIAKFEYDAEGNKIDPTNLESEEPSSFNLTKAAITKTIEVESEVIRTS